jgi:hypothetical protein
MGLHHDAGQVETVEVLSVGRALACSCLALAIAGCSRSAATEPPPPKVPVELVPPSLQNGSLRVIEKRSHTTQEAFTQSGSRVLIGEGRLWEIRDGQRLVGALEVATVKHRLNLRSRKRRSTLVRDIMPGSIQELTVGEVTVYATSSNDKVVYMWFGKSLFEILQLKGSTLDPEALLTDIIDYQTATDDRAELLILEGS